VEIRFIAESSLAVAQGVATHLLSNQGCYRALSAWKHWSKLGIWTTNSVDWCVVWTSQSWNLPNVHMLMICISVTTSGVLREISDIWCFGRKSDVDWAVVFPQFYILSGWR